MPLLIDDNLIEFDNLDLIDKLAVAHKELRGVAEFLQLWWSDMDSIDVKTSGSTGKPKVIALPKEAMIKSALKTAEYFQYKAGDTVLNSLPIEFIAGKMMIVRAIVSKLNLIVVSPTSVPLDGLGDYELAFVPMTPYQLQKTISQNSKELGQVRKILLGGGPVADSLINNISLLAPEIYHGYGMTETITHIAVRNLSKGAIAFSLLPGIEVVIGGQGELVIEADHLPEHIVTTDIGELYGDNGFLWLGRLDNVINTGGVKVHPEAIEKVLKPLLPCDCIIIGQEDRVLGQRVVCVLEAHKLPQDLFNLFDKHLDKFQRPKAVFLLPSFIRTSTQKIQRKPTFKAALDNL